MLIHSLFGSRSSRVLKMDNKGVIMNLVTSDTFSVSCRRACMALSWVRVCAMESLHWAEVEIFEDKVPIWSETFLNLSTTSLKLLTTACEISFVKSFRLVISLWVDSVIPFTELMTETSLRTLSLFLNKLC